jgi:hypothetical protein
MVQCAPRSRPQGNMGFSRHLAVPLRTDAWASAAFAPFVSTRMGIRPSTQALSLWLAGTVPLSRCKRARSRGERREIRDPGLRALTHAGRFPCSIAEPAHVRVQPGARSGWKKEAGDRRGRGS